MEEEMDRKPQSANPPVPTTPRKGLRVWQVLVFLAVLLGLGFGGRYLVMRLVGNPGTDSVASGAVPKYRVLARQGKAVVIASASPDVLREDQNAWAIADDIMRNDSRAMLQLMLWDDPSKAPHSLPMSDAETSSEVVQININTNTGLREIHRGGK
jgi:hypothetical protein